MRHLSSRGPMLVLTLAVAGGGSGVSLTHSTSTPLQTTREKTAPWPVPVTKAPLPATSIEGWTPHDARRNGEPRRLTRFHAVVTAYSSSPDETWGNPFITASGRRVKEGIVACPRRFPFGTQFRILEHVYTCWDRLHQRYDHRFDIWKSSKKEALEFGRKWLAIEVLHRRRAHAGTHGRAVAFLDDQPQSGTIT